jgi:Zn-dependent metalloprotease
MLNAIAESEAVPHEARQAALFTLDLTSTLRATRIAHVAAATVARETTSPPGGPSIIPPHLLTNLAAAQHAHPEARDAAQRTLHADESMRQQRKEVAEAQMLPEVTEVAPAHLNRLVYNCRNTTRLPGTVVRREGSTPTSEATINECYDGFADTFKLYYEIFQRNSIDDAGLNLLGSVHYSTKYNNAFWNGRQMVFGDGDGIYFNRFTTSVDVIGHELTHGVVQHTCNLEYQGESGALNESLADVFGTLVKQYKLKQKPENADWLIGEGLFTNRVKGVALRSMKSPGTAYDDPAFGKDPQPAHYKDLVITEQDAGGVHINSGIPNRAFYNVAIALPDYAWEKAGHIWYAAINDPKLTETADFHLFAQITVDQAQQLYGQGVRDIVKQGWADVGITVT